MHKSVFVMPAFAVLLCLSLTGCSGGGGGGVASTPPPPPPATALPVTTNTTFQTVSSATTYRGELSMGIAGGGNATLDSTVLSGLGPTVTFSYDPSSGTYTVQGANASASFTSTDQTPTSDYSYGYSKTVGTTNDKLSVYGNVKAGNAIAPPVQLSYTSYGLWTHSDSVSGKTSYTYFVFGQPTGSANVPTSGTGTYQTTVSASMFQTGAVPATLSSLSGSATFSADFGAGTVNTVLSLASDSFNGTGSISAGQFGGDFTSNATNFQDGKFQGAFFGPAAQEMGYAFAIHKHNPDPFAGASPAPADTYISGVVVGKKN